MARFSLAWLLLSALVAASAGAQDCATDDALTEAAAQLLARPDRPSPDEVREAVRDAGSDVPVVDAMLLGVQQDARERFLSRVRARHGSPLRCGEAIHAGRTFMLAGLNAGALRPTADDRLEVWLAEGFTEPRVYARDAEGQTWETETSSGERVSIPPDLRSPVVVQLLARGLEGPLPVAERRLGTAGPVAEAASGQPIGDRIDSLRRLLGRGSLRRNALLSRAAQEHAERVCRSRRVAHDSDRGDPEERLARAGIRARHVGETAARATDLDAAFRRTQRSPSHYAALTDRRFTDVGVGVADGESTCLVVLLAAWPRAVPY